MVLPRILDILSSPLSRIQRILIQTVRVSNPWHEHIINAFKVFVKDLRLSTCHRCKPEGKRNSPRLQPLTPSGSSPSPNPPSSLSTPIRGACGSIARRGRSAVSRGGGSYLRSPFWFALASLQGSRSALSASLAGSSTAPVHVTTGVGSPEATAYQADLWIFALVVRCEMPISTMQVGIKQNPRPSQEIL